MDRSPKGSNPASSIRALIFSVLTNAALAVRSYIQNRREDLSEAMCRSLQSITDPFRSRCSSGSRQLAPLKSSTPNSMSRVLGTGTWAINHSIIPSSPHWRRRGTPPCCLYTLGEWSSGRRLRQQRPLSDMRRDEFLGRASQPTERRSTRHGCARSPSTGCVSRS